MKFEGKWTPELEKFENACKDILTFDRDLEEFKRQSDYIYYIGNDVRRFPVAEKFYNYIKENYPHLLKWPKFKNNDMLGYPNVFQFADCEYSPGTLRFMKVVGDIERNFGEFHESNVIEIGSGYGGQAFIFAEYFYINSYTLLDLSCSLEIAKLYLNKISDQVNKMIFQNVGDFNLKKEYDLVISDYCFSELDERGMKFYNENVFSRCKNGYFTMNVFDLDKKNWVLSELKKSFSSIEELPENPKTTKHNNYILICKK